MTYAVKEIYFTLQGEGVNTSRAAVFCRFAGCNLWSGLERDRVEAVCNFCDTEFVGTDGPGGGTFKQADELAAAVKAMWPADQHDPFVVCTGGEPLLQLDEALIKAFHDAGFRVAVETNGTLPVPNGVDWVCVSPKADAKLEQTEGDELKLVYPQKGVAPEQFEQLSFDHFLLQPMDGSARALNTRLVLAYCEAHPRWKVSLQTHKYLGLP